MEYFEIWVMLYNSISVKSEFRKIITNILKFQTELIKKNLMELYKLDNLYEVRDFLTRSVELYITTKAED